MFCCRVLFYFVLVQYTFILSKSSLADYHVSCEDSRLFNGTCLVATRLNYGGYQYCKVRLYIIVPFVRIDLRVDDAT